MLFALPFTSPPFPLLELPSFSPWQPTAHSSHSVSCFPTILTTHAQSPKQTRTIPFLECHCRCSVIICTKTTKKSYCQWIYTRLACLHGEKLEGCKQQERNQFSYNITIQPCTRAAALLNLLQLKPQWSQRWNLKPQLLFTPFSEDKMGFSALDEAVIHFGSRSRKPFWFNPPPPPHQTLTSALG